jgi:hypothetical protein
MKLSLTDYNDFLSKVSKSVYALRNYSSYEKFENDWSDYYQRIYLKYSNENKPPRIFIAESAPEGIYCKNLNYIFHKSKLKTCINDKSDMYLYRYFRGVFPNSTPSQTRKLTKGDALVKLSEENILIVDLLPTHGIKLESNDRSKIVSSLLSAIDYSFLKKIAEKFSTHNINYAFSVPPSLYKKKMYKKHLNDNNFKEFGNVNTGQGHAPSITAINRIIEVGF